MEYVKFEINKDLIQKGLEEILKIQVNNISESLDLSYHPVVLLTEKLRKSQGFAEASAFVTHIEEYEEMKSLAMKYGVKTEEYDLKIRHVRENLSENAKNQIRNGLHRKNL